MKWLFSLAWCMVIFTINGQTVYIATDTLELEIGSGYDLDQNGRKNGEWEYNYDNNPKNYLLYKATFKSDTLNGPFVAYWSNGNVKAKINFENGLKTGPAFYYYDNGKLKYQMNYVEDTLQGQFITFFKSGRKVCQLILNDGRLNGHCRAFDDDADNSLFAEGDFLDGLPNGTYIRYLDKKSRIEEYFDHGFPSDNRKFFKNGKLAGEQLLDKKEAVYVEDISYKNGKTIENGSVHPIMREFLYGKYLYLPKNFR